MTTRRNNAGVSRYLRLYSVLSQALSEGHISVGQALPSELRLMREYAVSRSTVRRALARLEAEGRILRKRGSGTYAQKQGPAPVPAQGSPALNGNAAVPVVTDYRTIAVERIATPGFLARELPGFGNTVLLIRLIGYAGREPLVLETAYMPQAIGRRVMRRQLKGRPGRVADRLADKGGAILACLGRRGMSLEREFAALPADPVTANSLGLAVGAAILNIRTVARDSKHHILAYINLLHRPDRYEARTVIELHGRRRAGAGKRT